MEKRQVVRYDIHLIFFCTDCYRVHIHGTGEGCVEKPSGFDYGFRTSHCHHNAPQYKLIYTGISSEKDLIKWAYSTYLKYQGQKKFSKKYLRDNKVTKNTFSLIDISLKNLRVLGVME